MIGPAGCACSPFPIATPRSVHNPSGTNLALTLRQLAAMLAARRTLILGVTLLIFVATAVLTWLQPRTWTASASVYIDYRENDPLSGQGLSAMLDDSYLQTQLELLHSRQVAERVIESLRLRETPGFRKAEARTSEEKASEQLVRRILENTRIEQARGSRLVTILTDAGTAAQARDLANAIVAAYLRQSEDMTSSQARSRFEQYNAQLDQLRETVNQVQARLTRYQQDNDVLSVQDHGDLESRKLDTLTATLTELESELRTARSRRSALQSQLGEGTVPEDTPVAAQSPLITTLKSQLSDIDRQAADVQGALGPNHPTIRGLAQERARILSRIRTEAQSLIHGADNDVSRLEAQTSALRAEISTQRQLVLKLMQQRNQIAAYQRELDSAQQVYDSALRRYDSLSLASNILSPNVTIMRQAETPTAPSRPRVALNLLLGLLTGMVVAIGLALLLELAQRRLRSPDDLRGNPDLPLIGMIGHGGLST